MVRATDETYEALRSAAITLLATEGPAALTVRRIAAEAGVSTMNVYSRFGGKDGIVEELYVDGFERLGDSLQRVRSTSHRIADLRRCGQAYRQFAIDHPTSYAVMFDAAVPGFQASERASEVGKRTLGLLVERVQRALESGELHGQAEEIAVSLWATNHGVVSLEMKHAGPPYIDWLQMHRAALDAVIRGYSTSATLIEE